MSVTNRKAKMRRTQISLTAEDYEAAKKLAVERGESLSQVIRDALRRETAAEDVSYDPLGAIIGIVKNADPNASENVDEIVYGRSIR
jgi:hypothetical protein